MSDTAYSSITQTFNAYTAERVLAHFNVDPDNEIEVATMKFVFKEMSGHNFTTQNRLENKKEAVQATIEKLDYRYGLLKEHAPNFFPDDYRTDVEALNVATICDELLYDYDPEIIDEEGDVYLRDDGIDADLFKRANRIFDSAADLSNLEKHALQNASLESLVLMHINFLEDLNRIETSFEDLDKYDLLENLKTNILPMLEFINPDTTIGQLAKHTIESLSQDIRELFPSVMPQLALPPPSVS